MLLLLLLLLLLLGRRLLVVVVVSVVVFFSVVVVVDGGGSSSSSSREGLRGQGELLGEGVDGPVRRRELHVEALELAAVGGVRLERVSHRRRRRDGEAHDREGRAEEVQVAHETEHEVRMPEGEAREAAGHEGAAQELLGSPHFTRSRLPPIERRLSQHHVARRRPQGLRLFTSRRQPPAQQSVAPQHHHSFFLICQKYRGTRAASKVKGPVQSVLLKSRRKKEARQHKNDTKLENGRPRESFRGGVPRCGGGFIESRGGEG